MGRNVTPLNETWLTTCTTHTSTGACYWAMPNDKVGHQRETSRSDNKVTQSSRFHEMNQHIRKLNVVSDISLERDPGTVEFKCGTGKPLGRMKAVKPQIRDHGSPSPSNHVSLDTLCLTNSHILRTHRERRCTASADCEQDRVSLTHILNKVGPCLRIHFDVFKTFQ